MESAGSDPRLAAELPAFPAGVRIDYGYVPPFLPDAIVRGVLYEASRTEALLEVPDIARVHVRRDVITVSPFRPDIAAALGPFLRRTPLMILVLLRGGFGANGAALAGPDGALVLIGRTVSGKSTLAAALMKRGLRLMADDAVAMTVDAGGAAQVFPVWPELILWPDALEALFGNVPPWLGPADGEIPRRQVNRDRWCEQSMPLKRIYVLRPKHLETGIDQSPAKGVAGILQSALLPYQGELAAALADPAALLRLVAAIDAGRTQKLVFPQNALSEMDELAQRLVEECGWRSPT